MITDRDPWAEDSSRVLDWAKQNPMQGSVAWHSLANLFYITNISREFAMELTSFLIIPAAGTMEFHAAMKLNVPDPEDSMQISSAILHDADFLITRNLRHYRNSPIPALSPKAFLKQLG